MGLPAHIEIEHWNGPRSRRERLEHPSVLLLHDQLTRLDGDRIDSLWIEIENVGALDVGGGPDSFVVVAFPADGSSSHVETERKGQERVELQVGGQTGVFSEAMVLTLDEAFEIASRFLSTGTYDPALKWVRDCSPDAAS